MARPGPDMDGFIFPFRSVVWRRQGYDARLNNELNNELRRKEWGKKKNVDVNVLFARVPRTERYLN